MKNESVRTILFILAMVAFVAECAVLASMTIAATSLYSTVPSEVVLVVWIVSIYADVDWCINNVEY